MVAKCMLAYPWLYEASISLIFGIVYVTNKYKAFSHSETVIVTMDSTYCSAIKGVI